MTELTPDSIESDKLAIAQAGDLLTHYSFDLGHHTTTQLLDLWLQEYPAAWVRLAVIEALYQGRYKAVSVQQILQFWQRRRQPLYRFNGDFDRLICHKIPRNLNEQAGSMSLPSPPQRVPPKSPTVLPILPITQAVVPTGDTNAPSPRWAMLVNPVPLPLPPPTSPSTDVTSADRRARRRSTPTPPTDPTPTSTDVTSAGSPGTRQSPPVPPPIATPPPTDVTSTDQEPRGPSPSASPTPLVVLPLTPTETTHSERRSGKEPSHADAFALPPAPLTLPPKNPPSDLSHVRHLPSVPPLVGEGQVPSIGPSTEPLGKAAQLLTPLTSLEVSFQPHPSIQASVAALIDKTNSSLRAAAEAIKADLDRNATPAHTSKGTPNNNGSSSTIADPAPHQLAAFPIAADFHAKLKAVAEQQPHAEKLKVVAEPPAPDNCH